MSYGHLDVALLLAQRKDFDPDVQDGSGWSPLMIAVSLKDGEELVDLLLRKGADVNQTSKSHNLSYIDAELKSNDLDHSGQVRSLNFKSYYMC